MLSEVKGLVLRTTNIGESDRLLTIYTHECGVVTALAKGARSLKSRKLSATSQFCYSSFVLFEKGDKLWVKEASVIENFFDIRSGIESLALAGYIVEVMCDVATADAEPELLRLVLNSLYAISEGKYDLDLIKAAFEIRLCTVIGFMPDVLSCRRCDGRTGEFFFDIMAGAVECSECHKKYSSMSETLTDEHESHIICILPEAAKTAISYCIYSPIEKLFSFNVFGDEMRFFSHAAEEYLLNHLERGFKSLDFYKEVKG